MRSSPVYVMICVTFERWRTPPEIIMYSINYLYLGFRLSLRDVRGHLLDGWASSADTRRFAGGCTRQPRREALLSEALRRVSRIVLGESRVRVGGGRVWLWVALDPGGAWCSSVPLEGSKRAHRPQLLKKLVGEYGGDVVFVADGGVILLAAESLGARWVRLRGGSAGEALAPNSEGRGEGLQLRLPQEPEGLEEPTPSSGSTTSTTTTSHHSLDSHPPPSTPGKPAPRDCKGY